MCDDDYRKFPLEIDLLKKVQYLSCDLGIQCARCLVAQEHLGICRKRSCDRNSLFLTARKARRKYVLLIRKTNDLKHLKSLFPALFSGYSRDLQGLLHVRQNRSLVNEIKPLEDHGDGVSYFTEFTRLQRREIFFIELNGA